MKKINSYINSCVEWLKNHRTVITALKLAILAVLMLFSMHNVALVNVMLVIATIFMLTEFEFDGFYFSFFFNLLCLEYLFCRL